MKTILEKITRGLFVITIATLPLYLIRFTVFGFATNASEFLAFISIIFFLLIYELKDVFIGLRKVRKNLFLPIAVIVTGITLSLFIDSNFSSHGVGIIKGWFVIPILFSIAASFLFTKEVDLRRVFYSLYFSFFIVSIISVYYKLSGQVTYDSRLSSFYLSPNHLSMFLIYGVFIFPYIFSKQRKLLLRILLIISVLPILLSLYWTYSYSLWFSAIISIFLAALFLNGLARKSKTLLLGVALIFSVFFILQINSEKLYSILDSRSSTSSRIIIWQSSLKILSDNPVFGIGPGNFQNNYLNYQQYFPPYLEWAVPHPHNVYLAFWLQTGIIGFFAFLMLCLMHIQIVIKNKNIALSAIFLTTIFYIMIHGLLDTTFWKNDLAYLFWLFIFLGSALTDDQKSSL